MTFLVSVEVRRKSPALSRLLVRFLVERSTAPSRYLAMLMKGESMVVGGFVGLS